MEKYLTPAQLDKLYYARLNELEARTYFFRSLADIVQSAQRLLQGGDLELLLRKLKDELD